MRQACIEKVSCIYFSGPNIHGLYILGDGIDFWKPHKWQEEIEKYQVLCMVHDVFKIALHHGFFHMNRVNLLIIDECHHSFGNSSFNQIFTEHYHPLKERYPGTYLLPIFQSLAVFDIKYGVGLI